MFTEYITPTLTRFHPTREGLAEHLHFFSLRDLLEDALFHAVMLRDSDDLFTRRDSRAALNRLALLLESRGYRPSRCQRIRTGRVTL